MALYFSRMAFASAADRQLAASCRRFVEEIVALALLGFGLRR